MGVVMGIDIGQKQDPTAVCVAEREKRDSEWHFLIRQLERLPLGTPYPAVATRLAEIEDAVETRTKRRPERVFVDATGVGAPVVDLLREKSKARIVAVFFTYGDRRIEHSWREVTLGKAYLVSRLKTLFQTHRVHLPVTEESDAMRQELFDYEIHVDPNANDRYGAFRVGAHDDLVTALGLAVQIDPKFMFIGRATLTP